MEEDLDNDIDKLLITDNTVSNVCTKCGTETEHLRNGLCYGCTMLKG